MEATLHLRCMDFSLCWFLSLRSAGSRVSRPQFLGHMGLAPLRHVGSSWTDKDRTCVPCLGRWMLNHWTTREVLSQTIFMTVPQRFFLLPLLPVHPHVLSGLGVFNHRSDHNIILSALHSIMQTLPIVSLPPPFFPALSLLLPLLCASDEKWSPPPLHTWSGKMWPVFTLLYAYRISVHEGPSPKKGGITVWFKMKCFMSPQANISKHFFAVMQGSSQFPMHNSFEEVFHSQLSLLTLTRPPLYP